MRSCCIALCDSIRGKDKISFHEMPSDNKLRGQWIKAIYEHGINVGTASLQHINPEDFVCGRHFTADDYKPSNKVRSLKPDAVPSVFPQIESSLVKYNGVLNAIRTSRSKKKSLLAASHHQANEFSKQNFSNPAPLNSEAKKVKNIEEEKQSTKKGLSPSKKLKTTVTQETGSSDELPDVIFIGQKPVGLDTLKKLSFRTAIGGINSLRNAYILLCSKKEGNSSLSSEEIVNSCSFETSNKFNPRSLLRSSEDSATAAHGNSIETSSPASLQKQLDLTEQKIKDLQNYITKLKEQNVKLHWEKQSTLVGHLHNIRRDAVEGNYDAIMLLNQIVNYEV